MGKIFVIYGRSEAARVTSSFQWHIGNFNATRNRERVHAIDIGDWTEWGPPPVIPHANRC